MSELIKESDSNYDENEEEENIQTFKKLYLTGASLNSDFWRKFSNFYSFSDTLNSVLETINPMKDFTQLVESMNPIREFTQLVESMNPMNDLARISESETLKSQEMTEASTTISLKRPETTERTMELDTNLLLDTLHHLSESNDRLSETNRKLVEEKIESEKRYQGLREDIKILNDKIEELTKVRISRFKLPLAWLEKDIQFDENDNNNEE